MKMNREYIVKEGLLEAYFLGELSSADEQEVFEILQSDPELMKQYKDLEKNMEKLAFENAVTPPDKVKKALLNQISSTNPEKNTNAKVNYWDILQAIFRNSREHCRTLYDCLFGLVV